MILEIVVTMRHQAVAQAVGILAHHGTQARLGIQDQQIGAVIGSIKLIKIIKN